MRYLKLLFLLLFITSCSFEFEKDYVNEKIVAVNSNFDIQLINFNEGVVLREPTTLSFNDINRVNERLIEIQFFIDEVPVFETNELTGNFTIDTDIYEQGNHKLEVVYTFFSGSGSLADLTNQEGFIARKEYNFIVDKSLRAPIDIIEVKNIDGSVCVYWNKDDVEGVFEEAILLLNYETVKKITLKV